MFTMNSHVRRLRTCPRIAASFARSMQGTVDCKTGWWRAGGFRIRCSTHYERRRGHCQRRANAASWRPYELAFHDWTCSEGPLLVDAHCAVRPHRPVPNFETTNSVRTCRPVTCETTRA